MIRQDRRLNSPAIKGEFNSCGRRLSSRDWDGPESWRAVGSSAVPPGRREDAVSWPVKQRRPRVGRRERRRVAGREFPCGRVGPMPRTPARSGRLPWIPVRSHEDSGEAATGRWRRSGVALGNAAQARCRTDADVAMSPWTVETWRQRRRSRAGGDSQSIRRIWRTSTWLPGS